MTKARRSFAFLVILAISRGVLADEVTADVASAAAEPAGGLQEIVVTAQKRSENLQRVPIAVSVATEKDLEALHITSTEQLPALLPGLKVGNSAGSGLIYLRGIGQNSGAPGIVNPISTYLDGIYIGIARLGLFDLNSVSQVTLLKGPQGSLFGRNASGGIIQIATKDPSFDAKGDALLGYGNFDAVNGAFYATGAISDQVAANVSFKARREFDGEMTNVFTGDELLKEQSYSGQSKFLWKPADDTTVLFNAALIYSVDLRGVVNGPLPGYIANDGVTKFISEDEVRLRHDPSSMVDTKLTSLKVAHDFGWAELSNLVHGLWSNTNFKFLQGSGTAGRPNPNNAPDQTSTSFTNITADGDDLQLTSHNDGRFQWITGVSYEREHTDSDFAVYQDEALAANTVGNLTSEAWAGFLQGTFAIVPSTRVTAGVRYTVDTLDFSAVNTVNGATSASSHLPPSVTYDQVTWRGSIDHDLTDNVLIYISDNRGFKAGQYNITSISNPPVKPEIVDGYELGLKSQIFDNRVRLNTAFFYENASNLQLRANQGANVVLFNAAKAKIYGADVDFDAALSQHWSLKGGFEWLPKAEYTSFPNASVALPLPAPVIPSNCTGTPSAVIGGTINIVCNLSGYRMIFASKISADLSLQYAFEFYGGKAELNIGDSYSSRFSIDPSGLTSDDPYHLVSASAAWMSANGKWNARLWGTNLTNARSGYQGFAYIPGDPRKYGFEVGMKF